MGSQHVLKKRTLRSAKKKKERQSRANPELYHGVEGRYLYFQCQQYILRKQIAAVAELWSLPPEFEIICRDIWILHLSMLPDPVPEDPFLERQLHGKRDSERQASSARPESSRTLFPFSSEDDTDQDKSGKNDDADQDLELAELLRQNSETSSQEESGDERPTANESTTTRTRGRSENEGPATNLAVLMVALWTMRVPVLYRDFTRHIESYELPYLDAVRLLPKDMFLHLTKHNIQALSPAHAPDTINLHKLTSRLAKNLFSRYNIATPEANAAPIIWRVVQGLGGTPTLYRLTKRLSDVLSLPLALHPSLVPGLRRFKQKDPEYHKYDNAPVEIGFLAVTIIVLKLVYGLDDKTR
ncbi:hypothetical protein D9758_008864 [Tetrapyrgos nigripes]|uniref:Uncharacterized protein n=1 Tax=Tetrapyrgos nigripes TaxID=182062 RepID=A0A8H5FP96_9AGAR|nr:hypothetical protein D9758_008864 [Tetrapyrgos nigripes]